MIDVLRELKYVICFFFCLVLFFSLIIMFETDSSSVILMVSSIVITFGLLTILFASELNSMNLDYTKACRRFFTDLIKVDEEQVPLWMFG